METTTTVREELANAWIVFTEDFIDYSCEEHAKEWAEENGIPEESNGNYTLEKEGHGAIAGAYEDVFSEGETDYPVACPCGQYLRVSLTSDGEDYLREGDFPKWLLRAHLGD